MSRNGNAVTQIEEDEMVRLYQSGFSSNDIGKELGRCGRGVRRRLSNRGVIRDRAAATRLATSRGKIRNPNRLVSPDFFRHLTPGAAWVLGLIAGDGHVQSYAKRQQHTVYMAGSKEVMSKAAVLMGYKNEPEVHSQSDKCWTLRFSGWDIIKVLRDQYGMCGKKATTLRLPNLSDDMLPHYLRGLWDADGHWRRSNAGTLTTMLASASNKMCEDVLTAVSPHLMFCSEISIGHSVFKLNGKEFDGYRLSFRADVSEEFKWFVYKDSTERTRCARKYDIAFL